MRAIIKVTNENGVDGDIDSCGLYLIRSLIMSLLNIADLIISIIYFYPNCMAFFVIKFITIFFIFLFFLTLCCLYSYQVSENGMDALFPIFLAAVASIIILIFEIIFLVLFIINYSALNLIVQIFYFVHWAPIFILFIFLYFRMKHW